MPPSRFQVSPVRLISSSLWTFRSTIHFWSVVSRRNSKIVPDAWRSRHSRPGWLSSVGSGNEGGPFFIRKTCAHWVHLTVSPSSGTRASSNSYSVLHCGQLTSMGGRYLGHFGDRRSGN